jgi:broad specificity phosphatase PhoE
MGEWEVMSGQEVAESQPEHLALWLPSEWLNPGETGITAGNASRVSALPAKPYKVKPCEAR